MRKEKGLPEIIFTPADGFRERREERKKGNIEWRQLRLDGTLDAASLSEEGTVTRPPPSTNFSQAKAESSTTGRACSRATLPATPLSNRLKQ